MIEAMACGTPVIAWDAGSVPEIVDDGVTGFIVRSSDEAVAAVERAASLDRARIRAVFEKRFSVTAMANRYLDLYARVGRPPKWRRAAGRARARSDPSTSMARYALKDGEFLVADALGDIAGEGDGLFSTTRGSSRGSR